MINLLLVLAVFGLPGLHGLYAALTNPVVSGTNRVSYEHPSTRVYVGLSSLFFVLLALAASYHTLAG